MKAELTGTWLVEGAIEGEVLRLDAPLSFWGGFDHANGRIIDHNHPQFGACLTQRVVAIPGSRGSSGTPGVLGESIRRGTGPAAIVLTKADVNLAVGALTAQALYGFTCPILLIDQARFDTLADAAVVCANPSTERS